LAQAQVPQHQSVYSSRASKQPLPQNTMQSRMLAVLLCLGIFSQGEAAATHSEEWDYGEKSWMNVSSDDGEKNSCEGKAQSPINIPIAECEVDEALGGLDFKELGNNETLYKTTLEVNEYSWQVKWSGEAVAPPKAEPATERRLAEPAKEGEDVGGAPVKGSAADPAEEAATGGVEGFGVFFNDKTFYELEGFRFHSPSEHTLNGEHFDMEVEFMHEATGGKFLVISTFLKVGAENEYLAGFWNLFENVTAPTNIVKEVRMSSPYEKFMPEDKSYVTYGGSSTTPPCQEGETKVVLTAPVELSAEQLGTFRGAMNQVNLNKLVLPKGEIPGVSEGYSLELGVNNRPVQPLEGRVLKLYEQPKEEEPKQHSKMWIIIGSIVAGLGVLGLGGLAALKFLSGGSARKPQKYASESGSSSDSS